MTPRLLERYRSDVHSKLMDEFATGIRFQVPTLSKIVVNIGLGEAAANPKLLEKAAEELAVITGQKPIIRRARKSVANFKLRAGQAIGCMVTLRGHRMWEFLDRLTSVALPAGARLQGDLSQGVRRARQLHARHPGADHLSRGRLRQGREDHRNERDGLYDGEDGCGGEGVARPPRHSLPPVAGAIIMMTDPVADMLTRIRNAGAGWPSPRRHSLPPG